MGAKYNKCPASTACGGTSLFYIIKDKYSSQTINIQAKGMCTYTFYYVLTDPTTDFTVGDNPQRVGDLGGTETNLLNTFGYFRMSHQSNDPVQVQTVRYFSENDVGSFTELYADRDNEV